MPTTPTARSLAPRAESSADFRSGGAGFRLNARHLERRLARALDALLARARTHRDPARLDMTYRRADQLARALELARCGRR